MLLYLALTMAPFAVVAPFIGPWMDRQRGGRRAAVIGSLAVRGIVCLFMAEHLDRLLLFPEAFAVLVLGKGYGVARAAIVPALVRDERGLVEANAKLTLVSGVVGFIASVPGVLLLQIGAAWVLLLAAVVFGVGAVLSLRIPAAEREPGPETPAEDAELHRRSILVAASQMAVLRGTVGFLAFLLAFSLRRDDAPAWWFGLVLAASAIGALAGAGVAPLLRRWTREESIIFGSLIAVSVGAVVAIQVGGRLSAIVLATVVGVAASAGRLCFDAIVQRDAPDADQGRSFARFETRFQLMWVGGAFIPVVLSLPRTAGYIVIAVAASAAAASAVAGRIRA